MEDFEKKHEPTREELLGEVAFLRSEIEDITEELKKILNLQSRYQPQALKNLANELGL